MGYFVEKIPFYDVPNMRSKVFSNIYEANALLELWLGNDRDGLYETYPSEANGETDLRFIVGYYGPKVADYYLVAETAEDKQRAIAEGFKILVGSAYNDLKLKYANKNSRGKSGC